MTYVVVQFQKRKKKNQKYADNSHKILVLKRPEDKKQKENETPELLHRARIICFSWVDVDDELMMVNVATLRQYRIQHYLFEEHLVIFNFSKPSGCLQ